MIAINHPNSGRTFHLCDLGERLSGHGIWTHAYTTQSGAPASGFALRGPPESQPCPFPPTTVPVATLDALAIEAHDWASQAGAHTRA